jgi:hypothetical protein
MVNQRADPVRPVPCLPEDFPLLPDGKPTSRPGTSPISTPGIPRGTPELPTPTFPFHAYPRISRYLPMVNHRSDPVRPVSEPQVILKGVPEAL